MTGPSAMANWYGIWASAVSIAAMCVSIGEEGVSVQECMTSLSLACVVVCRTDATPQLVMQKLQFESYIKILWICLKRWRDSKVGIKVVWDPIAPVVVNSSPKSYLVNEGNLFKVDTPPLSEFSHLLVTPSLSNLDSLGHSVSTSRCVSKSRRANRNDSLISIQATSVEFGVQDLLPHSG